VTAHTPRDAVEHVVDGGCVLRVEVVQPLRREDDVDAGQLVAPERRRLDSEARDPESTRIPRRLANAVVVDGGEPDVDGLLSPGATASRQRRIRVLSFDA
jgi:hypothetical protein